MVGTCTVWDVTWLHTPDINFWGIILHEVRDKTNGTNLMSCKRQTEGEVRYRRQEGDGERGREREREKERERERELEEIKRIEREEERDVEKCILNGVLIKEKQ